ncbi:two-component sensor histidine kinase [Streptomyces longispororuber]|uniref:histidine kinase n=1 Tax=Streptomyces longispororuber TaxID=68230 RepID=A0A918Z2L7_9ACTN|nr:histidine kinase [Streptomyces longispororuber]GHE34996.1 two-component sensor histidine kinase [Streptomyces longispororuber]
MTRDNWTRWPVREALSPEGLTRPRRVLTWVVRAVFIGVLLWSTFARRDMPAWGSALAMLMVVLCAATIAWYFRATLQRQAWTSLCSLGLLAATGAVAQGTGFHMPAAVLWCSCAILALERLPLGAAMAAAVLALGAFALVNEDLWPVTAAVTVGLGLAGYVLRLDAEARGNAQRLLAQERAARAAEAESAALAERARIAREIHDVLAHSLSAQMVHLEAARLLIERDADRKQIHERVVAARAMAAEGLAETRQALSALRGEMTPVEDYLCQLAGEDGTRVAVSGERRALAAEASQAVRRVAQEALTNVRKHAPGAKVTMCLEYGKEQVTLDVRDSGGAPGDLTASGAGYGLLGMRERAELLGGSLEAGPEADGFAVRLRVPG